MTTRTTVKSRDLGPTPSFLIQWPPAVAAAGPPPAAECRSRSGDGDGPGVDAVFPGRPRGEDFVAAALAAAQRRKRFAALAVRVDARCGEEPGDTADPAEAMRIVSTVLDARDGVWGLLEPDVIGCVFPGADIEEADGAVEVIGSSLGRMDAGSVTAGIAAYPFHDFSPEETIGNARKAVDHAAFFGPGSKARFDAVSLNVSGDIRYQDGDIGGAASEFERALTMEPDNANLRNSLGVCHAVRGDYPAALAAFEAAAASAPEEVTGHYNAGLVHLLKDDPEAALACFEKAVGLDDAVFEIHFQMGRLLAARERLEEAVGHLLRAAELEPGSAAVHRLLGEARDAQGDPASAVDHYKKAVRLHPNDAASLSMLGVRYADRGEDIDLCIAFCRQSVEIEPECGPYRLRLADLLRRAGRDGEALEVLRRARDLGEDCGADIESLERSLTKAAS